MLKLSAIPYVQSKNLEYILTWREGFVPRARILAGSVNLTNNAALGSVTSLGLGMFRNRKSEPLGFAPRILEVGLKN